MKKEIQKLIATWLIDLTFWILPDGEFKKQYANFMLLWMREL